MRIKGGLASPLAARAVDLAHLHVAPPTIARAARRTATDRATRSRSRPTSDHAIAPIASTAPDHDEDPGFGVIQRLRGPGAHEASLQPAGARPCISFTLRAMQSHHPQSVRPPAGPRKPALLFALALGFGRHAAAHILRPGAASLGRYEGASRGHLRKPVTGASRRARCAAWIVLFGPYGLYLIFRGLALWWRAGTRLA